MLSRNRRVPTILFDRIIKDGVSFHSAHFSVRYLKTEDIPYRIGVAIPKKVEGRAVGRVSLKRKMRSCFEEIIAATNNNLLGSVIFFAKAGAATLTHEDMKTELQGLLLRL